MPLHRLSTKSPWLRVVIGAALLVGVIWVGHLAEADIPALEAWVQGLGPLGPAVFIVVFVVLTAALIPESPFCLIAGALFGLGWGTLYTTIAGLLCANVVFLVARTFLRARIQERLQANPKLMALEHAASRQGLRLLLLIRLTPIHPTLMSYILGASSVRYQDYLFACIALIPGYFVSVYAGYTAKHMTHVANSANQNLGLEHVAMLAGLVVCGVVFTIIARVAKKAIDEAESVK